MRSCVREGRIRQGILQNYTAFEGDGRWDRVRGTHPEPPERGARSVRCVRG